MSGSHSPIWLYQFTRCTSAAQQLSSSYSSVNANGFQRLCIDSGGGLGLKGVFASCFAGCHAGRAQELLVVSSEDVKAAPSGHQSSLFGRDFPLRAAGLLISSV